MKKNVLLVFPLTVLLSVFNVHAADVHETLKVSTSVPQSCSFGVIYPNGRSAHVEYDAFAIKNGEANYFAGHAVVDVKCNLGSENVRMIADEGLHKNASSTCAAPRRRMFDGNGNYLEYNLRQNKDYDWYIWGCDESNQMHLSFAQTTLSSFHGIIVLEMDQNVFEGLYSDTITLTVLF